MISVHMVKICSDSIWEPLKLILLSCFDSGNLSSESKIVIVVPVQRKMVRKAKKLSANINLLKKFTITEKNLYEYLDVEAGCIY